MNKKKYYFYFLFAFILLISFYVGLRYFSTSNVDIQNAPVEITVNAEKLTASFIKDESAANELYKDKVVEVFGIIKGTTFVNKTNTIILQSDYNDYNVICDMQVDSLDVFKQLKPSQKVTIKGVCKGFLHDVILLNCMFINTQNND
ncbi:OB-fold protein [Flavivirga jejuensis]|uniref:Nucleic acid binding protein n=1 Tax=Flavivirga jejuensis TaxID=870487 RepID=A0ABT8WR49_9FLAO|nr:hypothetical protein [Flavivirga jejuensis]MDO5975474.1 hypothetical protein [Flavivirga jejuensis]